MPNRNSHSGKSRSQREYYQRAIARTDYEQTSDESLDFDNSDSTKIFENPNDDSVQKAPFSTKIGDFCKEHMVGIITTIISSIVIGIFSLLTINLNRESGEHSRDISNIKETVTELKIDVSSASEVLGNMKVLDAEQSKDIEFLKSNINKIERDIDNLNDKISK